ncbi:hypothetical protein GCM10022289_03770 [Pedobacter jeongneungensis]|uniref:Class I SAM-dependent methyltransferase n=2 Tax=Pedobacter jeongneungensis TaxID=947309 RepID=A0ABP8B3C5_9SPHI
MGSMTMGPDKRLVEFIKEKYQITNFIETGTYQGGTTEWSADVFKNVYSIEFSEHWYNHTKERLKSRKNVNLLFGDTKSILPDILPEVNNAILWLDAHWCGDYSFGEKDQCPLLVELEIINRFKHLFDKLFIMIDDARLFLSPPPHPHSLTDYPDFSEIMQALTPERQIYVFNDIILAVPKSYRQEFNILLQNLATEDLKVDVVPMPSIKNQIVRKFRYKISTIMTRKK